EPPERRRREDCPEEANRGDSGRNMTAIRLVPDSPGQERQYRWHERHAAAIDQKAKTEQEGGKRPGPRSAPESQVQGQRAGGQVEARLDRDPRKRRESRKHEEASSRQQARGP